VLEAPPREKALSITLTERFLRALFLVREDAATFVFLGDHDQVRRFLRDL
jgi:hypothetical protein